MRLVSHLVTPAAVEPVTLAEAKKQCRVTGTFDDTHITALIKAATRYCEDYQNRAYITQTRRITINAFPQAFERQTPLLYGPGGVVKLPRPPLIAITSVTYIDPNGTEQTFSDTKYELDTDNEPGHVRPVYGEYWPTPRTQQNAGTITYTCGYGDGPEDVPETIRLAIRMLVGHWYENREAAMTEAPTKVPLAVESLLALNRVVNV